MTEFAPITTFDVLREQAAVPGVQIEFTAFKDRDTYDMPAWNMPDSGGWIPLDADSVLHLTFNDDYVTRMLANGLVRVRVAKSPSAN